jgi:hypothetical protein
MVFNVKLISILVVIPKSTFISKEESSRLQILFEYQFNSIREKLQPNIKNNFLHLQL